MTTDRRKLARLCLVAGLILAALWIERHLLPALVWAMILAIATAPLHARLKQSHPGLSAPVALPAIFTLLLALIVLVPLGLGVAEAAKERADILNWIASARANGVPVPQWVHQLPAGGDDLAGWWQASLGTPSAASRQLGQLHAAAVHHSRIVGDDVLHRAVLFGLTLLAYFFLLRDRELILSELRAAGDRALGPTSDRLARQVALSVRGTINGLVLVGIGEGAVMTVVYWFAGTPHPLLLGAATAIAAMIPFGAVLMFAVAGLLLLAQGAAFAAGAVVVIGLIVVAIADHVVRPALIGGSTRLPVLLVLFGILGGVETLGLLGLFVGPAVMAVLVMLWRDYVAAAAVPD